MKTREEINAWLDELERVIDKSIEAMEASSERIDELEAALREIITWSQSGGGSSVELQKIARAALDRK